MANIRRIISICLVLCLFVTVLPLQALAADDTEAATETTVEGGITTTVTTTTTTSTDENGNTTVTVTIDTVKTGTDETGAKVDYHDTVTESTATETAADGTVTVTESKGNEGYETKEWDEIPEGMEVPETETPDVIVSVTPGETTSGTASDSASATDEDGTTTTVTTDRNVSVDAGDMDITVNDPSTGIVEGSNTSLEGLYPVYDEEDYDANGNPDKQGVFDANYLKDTYGNPLYNPETAPEDGEYCYVGVGEHTKYFIATVAVYYERDKDGNLVYDENGEPVIEQIKTEGGTVIKVNGEPATELTDPDFYSSYTGVRPTSFTLMDKNGNIVGAYCCDMDTDTTKGAWYSVSNLEDSDYYVTEESEAHIRAIALNGYWGTSDIPDEDGNYRLGSLEYVKEKLTAAIENGDIPAEYTTYLYDTDASSATFGKLLYDENGDPMVGTFNMLDLVDGLTEGEAIIAMQAAIWSYSNGSRNVMDGEDGVIVADPSSRGNFKTGNSIGDECLDNAANARIEFLYNWLITAETDMESTTVINDKNFIDDMNLVVGEQVDEVEATDENGDAVTNGIYDTALNFTLAFIPGENDDLLMQLKYTDLDGNEQTIVKRLAGTNAEGESWETIVPAEDGSYTISGLKFSENKDFNFDLRLEGTQYLENGVYLYSAVGGRDASQTLVGVAEGTREVDISASMTVSFSVDEENRVVAERVWVEAEDPTVTVTPPEEEDPPVEEEEPPVEEELPPPPPIYEVNIEEDGAVVIEEEPVPLADAPKTGSDTFVWFILILAAAFGLTAVKVFGKKRQHNAF